MSAHVLLALAGVNLFKKMNKREAAIAMTALITEIESDPELRQRFADAIGPSADELRSRRSMSWEG